MEITQQVRNYAARLNDKEVSDPLGLTPARDAGPMVSDPKGLTPAQGMAQMSARFRDMGGQVYVDADKAKAASKARG
jgi:phosphomethylpyrimidine synthase